MNIRIYWCQWDGKTGSHDLLKKAVELFKKEKMNSFHVCREGENEKPYIRELPELHFSISHSEDLWSCAIGDCEVGLDLQKQYGKNGEKLARRFFHPEEIQWLEINGFHQFSRLWAYKESYVKFTGVGLRNGLDYFSVIPAVSGNSGISAQLQEGKLCQKEIPFQRDFWMVLTTEAETEAKVLKLQDSGKECFTDGL